MRIRAQEVNSFRRKTHGKRLRDFALRRQEKFRYICDTLDMWEWEIRVLDVEPVEGEDVDIVCLKRRGAAPPENCGRPRGYRLMLTRQEADSSVSDPVAIAASMKVLVEVSRDEPEIDWPPLKRRSSVAGRVSRNVWSARDLWYPRVSA